MMDNRDDGEQVREPVRGPWRFRGAVGPVVVSPDARILVVQADVLYDTREEPPKKIGVGSSITFLHEGAGAYDQLVLDSLADVERQITERGGWNSDMGIPLDSVPALMPLPPVFKSDAEILASRTLLQCMNVLIGAGHPVPPPAELPGLLARLLRERKT